MMIVTSSSPSADQEKFLKSLKRGRTRKNTLIRCVEGSIREKRAEELQEQAADAIRLRGLGVLY